MNYEKIKYIYVIYGTVTKMKQMKAGMLFNYEKHFYHD